MNIKIKQCIKYIYDAIEGIPDDNKDDKIHYSFLFISKIIFAKFIEQKGLLNNNYNYLIDKFNQYQGNYLNFLNYLFISRFNNIDIKNTAGFIIGDVPFINHEIFNKSDIENKFEIIINENVIKEFLLLLNTFKWKIQESLYENDDIITTKILGMLTESSVDQKKLGAFYTPNDVSNYINKNTIIPAIFDLIDISFPGIIKSFILSLNIDDYVYSEIDNYNNRLNEIQNEFKNGNITNINDFISLNLNIEKFAIDFFQYIFKYHNENIDCIYDILCNLKILDPACGSGEFLISALYTLLPIYKIVCQNYNMEDFFILKTIIENNLYGIDICKMACETAKLRLYLHLIDKFYNNSLPEINYFKFNIICGDFLTMDFGLNNESKDGMLF